MALILVNPSDRDWTEHDYVLCFGAYGWTKLRVWANSLEDALDEAVDWIADNEPGLLADDEVKEEFDRLCVERGIVDLAAAEDDVLCAIQEEAEIDTTIAGDAGHYLYSWEWGIVAEDPDRNTIKRIIEECGGVEISK
jgi:hypothetical protein